MPTILYQIWILRMIMKIVVSIDTDTMDFAVDYLRAIKYYCLLCTFLYFNVQLSGEALIFFVSFSAAFGTICFSVRMGCLQPHIPANSQTYEMMSATSEMFQAVQKTTFSFPLYAIYRTALYRQFITASHTCHRSVGTKILIQFVTILQRSYILSVHKLYERLGR